MPDPTERPEWAEYVELREDLESTVEAAVIADRVGEWTPAHNAQIRRDRAALDAFVLRLLAERREPMGYGVAAGPVAVCNTLEEAREKVPNGGSIISLHPVEP